MSHFYASMQGNRGEATRCGSKQSGIDAHIRGWNSGVRVSCRYNKTTGRDECFIYATGGSNRSSQDIELGSVVNDGDGFRFVKSFK